MIVFLACQARQEPMSQRAFNGCVAATARNVAEALGKRLRSVKLPLGPFLIAAVMCETGCRPFGISPPWHRRRLDFFVKRFAFSLDKAERLLGYKPTVSFDEGARETAEWYRSHGYL